MNSRSEISELIGIVSHYLREELRPELDGRHAFLTLVASNLLDSLARETVFGDEAALGEHARLRQLLGIDGDIDELNAELCRRVNRGKLNETSPDLMAHLTTTTLDRLAIEQPGYEAYRRERGL